MKKVYFYLIFYYDEIDEVDECCQSELFNSIEEAFESKELCVAKTSPIMEGWCKE